MQVTRRVMFFALASTAMIATIALVGVGLSHARAMRENASFMGSLEGHMSQRNHGTRDDNVSSYMNVTNHIGGNTYSMHEDMHSQLNVTEHMQALHEEGNMTAPHMENNRAYCHD